MDGIKAYELRLGNLIKLPAFSNNFKEEDRVIPELEGFAYCVFATDLNVIRDAERLGDNWAGKPVPLTEDWLEKFGLKWYNGYYRIFFDGYSAELRVQKVGEIFNIWMKRNNNKVRLGELYSVHQLQNICSDIIRKELTMLPPEELK